MLGTLNPDAWSGADRRGHGAGPVRAHNLVLMREVQRYLAHMKHPSRRTLQQPYASEPLVILGAWVFLRARCPCISVMRKADPEPLT